MVEPAEGNFRFADFELDRQKRVLLRDGEKVAVTAKAIDLLEVLLERAGETVTKEELLQRIWEGQFVEESNLTVQVSTLRKLLGEEPGENKFIATVPGSGYRFVAEVASGPVTLIIEDHAISRVLITEQERARSPRRRLIVAGLIACGVIGIAAGGYFLLRSRSGRPFEHAVFKQLTRNGKVSTAALSPDRKLFAYVTNDAGVEALHLQQVDGGNDVVLRQPARGDYSRLAFAPDGGTLYFSYRDGASSSSALFKMATLGGPVEKLREGVGAFALAADGPQFAFANDRPDFSASDLVVWTSGSDGQVIKSFPKGQTLLSDSISFSPDGRRLAYAVYILDDPLTTHIYSVASDGSEVTEFATAPYISNVDRTAWLPDGTIVISGVLPNQWPAVPRYALFGYSTASGTVYPISTDLSSYGSGLDFSKGVLLTVEQRQMNNIWTAPTADLRQVKQVTFGSFGQYDGLWGLDWTPEGRLVFDSSDTTSQEISMMNTDGTERRQLTSPGYIETALSVSSDGRYAVFHSTRGGGGFDIWRMDLANGELKQLTFNRGSYQPAISPDARSVYYKCWEDGHAVLKRVPIDGGESKALTTASTSWPAVSPDGKLIAASMYVGAKHVLAIIPAEGGDPVKQFDVPETGTFYVGLAWAADGKSLIYRDEQSGYWQQSLAGGPPVRIPGLPNERLYNFAFSKDGKQLAFVRGEEISDVVLLTEQQ
ncbi:MAG: PD40 domain-containing protein [Acidobacteria bacterium]|nr:PD40 domain-containing protein [Acidobacteriota bacterium]